MEMTGDPAALTEHPNVMGYQVDGQTLIVQVSVNPDPDAADYHQPVMHDLIRRAYKCMKEHDLKDVEFQKVVIN
jgi:hypothetical protein